MNTKPWFTVSFVALFCLLAVLYLLPAVYNGFPKGSDSYYHMRISNYMLSSGSMVLFDPFNAGGSPNTYPPLFHLSLAGAFSFSSPMAVSTYLGPLLALLSAMAFFLFSSSLLGRKLGLVATFIYGVSIEIINTAIFTAPVNLGLIFMFLSLYTMKRYLTEGRRTLLYLSILFACLLALTHTITFLVFLLSFVMLFGRKMRLFKTELRKNIAPPLLSAVVFVLWLFLSGGTGSTIVINPAFNPVVYFWMFQPVFMALMIPGLLKAKRSVILWFAILLLWMLFVPLYPERIATYSIIPASIIAASGFGLLYEKANNIIKPLLIIFVLSSLLFLGPMYFTKTEIREQDVVAMEWIKERTPEDSVIASTWQVSGAWIPALAERTNVLGAFYEAVPDYLQRQADLETIFISSNESAVRLTLERYDTDYVFINGFEEDVLYEGATERLGSILEEVYSDGYVHIYKV